MIDEFEKARVDIMFVNKVAGIRDMLEPIASGEITRGHCSPGTRECYGGKPGKRKTTLADARKIAHHAIIALNRAINEFDEANT